MAIQIDLQNKTALITGATSGIGLGISKMFAKAGCNVIGCAELNPDQDEVLNFVSLVEAEHVQVRYIKTDLTQPSAITSLVASAAEFGGGEINYLVSNAGRNVFTSLDHDDEESWEYNINLNLAAHWRLALKCKPYLEKNRGVVIVMASNHAFSTIPGCFPYNVIKTALTGLVRSMAIEWGPNIRTLGIAPGFIDTPGNQKWFDRFPNPAEEKQRTIDLHPTKSIGSVEEIGAWCAFLVSEYAAFASGTTYLIDGGRSALMQDS